MVVANPCRNDARVIKEAESLAAHGARVRVFCLAEAGLPEFESRAGVEYLRCRPAHKRVRPAIPAAMAPAAPGSALQLMIGRLKRSVGPFVETALVSATFARAITAYRPDIVHAHDFNTLPAAVRAAKAVGARLVYDMHEMEEARQPPAGRLLSAWKNGIERRAMRRVDGAITVSPSIALHYARKHGIEPPELVLNAPRVEIGRLRGPDLRSRLGLAAGVPLAVYVGGVSPGRGNEHMLEAVRRMSGVHLAIAGVIRPEMQALIDHYARPDRLGGRLHYVGLLPHDQVVPFIRSADVGLCTILGSCLNYEYCLPNKLFEMTFAGLPLVVSDNRELARFVARTGTGVAVRADDPDAIAAGIVRVYAARTELRPGPARLAALYGEFGWERQEERLVGLYRRLTEGP